jgi:hypothetical protein
MDNCSAHVTPEIFRLLGPVGVDATKALERIEVPDVPFDEPFMYPETVGLPSRPGTQQLQRVPIPGPPSFAISLAEYIEKVTGTCPLRGHEENAELSDDEEEEID